jgi:DNA-3-methyladenine glycosylase
MPRPLPQSFYARESLEVACDLVGKVLVHGCVELRITEVEAYRHGQDTANHCRFGRTARNAPMWGPPGHAYVYLCYGMHQMLNLVTDPEECGAAVLLRSAELVRGGDEVRTRRRGIEGPAALTGPGKVAAALGVDTSFSGRPLFRHGALMLRDGAPPARLLVGPRVGVDYAAEAHARAPWRVAAADTLWVSHRKTLSPLDVSVAEFLRAQTLRAESGQASSPSRQARGRKPSP